MEALLSAVASDLVGRLVSFLISKFQEPGSTDDVVERLQRALLRARVVVEEAEARQVTNRAMLLQLNQLRGEMCRGVYIIDAFTRPAVERGRRSHATARWDTGRLSVVVDTLEAALSDMKEFVVLLGGCPRLNQQPYSAYLFMERCMFGRQMEKEHIVSFLLQPARDLEVLPIIGPHEVGKRTLVEHVCLEERVRERFAKIHRLCSDDLDVRSQESLQASIDSAERSLFVIDLSGGDKDEERWKGFHTSVRRRTHGESKIIIISRTEAHSGLGTVPPLRLRALRREELWYFFKVMAFGGADPEERPEIVRVATALFAGVLDDLAPLATVSKIAASLRADLSVRSWRRVLRVSAGVTVLHHQLDAAGERWWIYYPCGTVEGALDVPCFFYDRRKSTGVARSELPTVTMLEVGHVVISSGGEKRFDVLVWQSRIPPYASYVATCDMERAAQVEVGKKRLLNKRRDQPVGCSGQDKVGP
ncbi:unnamed protein product [Urochloa decumbens]|uniref:Disease resistance N-terminal domain-containing protein n=1 Tax=Urochloa decumbens TaxID=240449 RepID=A0ABC8YZS2_9POAL